VLRIKWGRYAWQKLVERGVEVRTGTKVAGYINSLVAVSRGEAVPAATLIWTAGVTPNPVIAQLPCNKENGRIIVDEFLEVQGFAALWAMGDCAAVPDANTGRPQPTFFTQGNQAHRDLLSREAAHREELYSQFIKEAANLYIDSLDKTLENRPR